MRPNRPRISGRRSPGHFHPAPEEKALGSFPSAALGPGYSPCDGLGRRLAGMVYFALRFTEETSAWHGVVGTSLFIAAILYSMRFAPPEMRAVGAGSAILLAYPMSRRTRKDTNEIIS